MAKHMPADRNQARAWLHEQELSSRKNERMIDKIMGALPRELSHEQQNQLVRGYAEKMTQGRAPWFAAIHRQGKDADNPHMHLVIRDRDPETRKKVAQLSSKGSTERVRLLWEQQVNQALTMAGHEVRVDRRSLKAQGLDREPTIHVGPKANGMHKKGHRPKRPATVEHEPSGTLMEKRAKQKRMTDYRQVSRVAYNARISASMGRKHTLEREHLVKQQNAENAAQKAAYERELKVIQQRLQVKGIKRLVRNVTGKTRKDQEAFTHSRRDLGAIQAQETKQRKALEQRQAQERHAEQSKQLDRMRQEIAREQNNQRTAAFNQQAAGKKTDREPSPRPQRDRGQGLER